MNILELDFQILLVTHEIILIMLIREETFSFREFLKTRFDNVDYTNYLMFSVP